MGTILDGLSDAEKETNQPASEITKSSDSKSHKEIG
jgi:hypothetical protein